ncbi:hypothetical protein [Myxococcus faecalis]|uniref:hypothetical protein n=1 Tax=Myxococcus faecalis TaxID=3115646 RepID=UPI003CEAE06C
MTTTALDPNSLEKVEQSLALMRPFGDGDYIDARTRERYEQRLGMLAPTVPEARAFLDALKQSDGLTAYRIIGDPVVRDAVHTLLGHFTLHMPQHDVEDCLEVLRVGADHLTRRTGASPLSLASARLERLGDKPHHGWVWMEERQEDVFGRRFKKMYREHLPRITTLTPDAKQLENLRLGTQLLEELLPELSRSALTHTHLVVISDIYSDVPQPPGESGIFTSVTNPHVLGTIFLAPHLLRNPWIAAEYLLHESLHQKFLDLEHTHSMLRRGYKASESPVIIPPWHRARTTGPDRWEVNRSISVTHVYTALALFFSRVHLNLERLQERYGPIQVDVPLSIRQSFDRATYLGEKLQGAEDELGLAGQRFLGWLNQTLKLFDPAPPPPGSYVHLLLDLYDREAQDIAARLTRASDEDLSRELGGALAVPELTHVPKIVEHLVDAEVRTARDALGVLGVEVPERLEVPASDIDAAPSGREVMAERFKRTRMNISQALRKASWTTYQQTTADALVRDMVVTSGQRLNMIIKHLNPNTFL